MPKVFANNPYEGLTVVDAMSAKQAPMITGGVQAPVLPQTLDTGMVSPGINFGSLAGSVASAIPAAIDIGTDIFGKAPEIDLVSQPSISDGSLFSMASARENQARINAAEGLSVGNVLGSAGKGLSAGAAFGPIGAGIGAAVGALGGLIGGRKRKKEKERAKRKAEEQARSYTRSFNQRVAADAMEDATQDRISALKNKYTVQPSFRSLI